MPVRSCRRDLYPGPATELQTPVDAVGPARGNGAGGRGLERTRSTS
jgi:hypothetical protein